MNRQRYICRMWVFEPLFRFSYSTLCQSVWRSCFGQDMVLNIKPRVDSTQRRKRKAACLKVTLSGGDCKSLADFFSQKGKLVTSLHVINIRLCSLPKSAGDTNSHSLDLNCRKANFSPPSAGMVRWLKQVPKAKGFMNVTGNKWQLCRSRFTSCY